MARPVELLVVIAGISMSTALQNEITNAVGAVVAGKVSAGAETDVVLHPPSLKGNSHVIRIERAGDGLSR